jgi:hypothetical protein
VGLRHFRFLAVAARRRSGALAKAGGWFPGYRPCCLVSEQADVVSVLLCFRFTFVQLCCLISVFTLGSGPKKRSSVKFVLFGL